jgi:mannose-6-phosphate isomerase
LKKPFLTAILTEEVSMTATSLATAPLYPLRFEPIFQPRIWGGRWLGELLGRPLPGTGPIGEAWVLSDQGDSVSRVAEGPLQDTSLHELMAAAGERIVGPAAKGATQFPLLLKFLDARDKLSVQVHPSDAHKELLPAGQRGKTEAWLVLRADPGSRIYAGLTPGTTASDLRRALAEGKIAQRLGSFVPKAGDCVFLPAGTVHALDGGLALFEVQQNSDMTFRLYDWGRVDAQTGKPRQLHIEQSLACTDFASVVRGPVAPVVESRAPVQREQLVSCPYFQLWRLTATEPFSIGADQRCSILTALEGEAVLRHRERTYALRRGDVLLLPAAVGACHCAPAGKFVLLESTPGQEVPPRPAPNV